MNKIKSYIIPTCLAILTFLLTFSFISKGPYHSDCIRLAVASQSFVSKGEMQFLHGHGYPLIAFLGVIFHFVATLFGVTDPVIAVNFMNVFFSALCVFPLFAVTKILFSQKTAILSTLLVIFNPLFLSTSIYGNSHTPFIFFLFVALLYLMKYFSSHQKRMLIVGAVFLGLAGAARIQDFFLVIIPLTFLYFFIDRGAGYVFKRKSLFVPEFFSYVWACLVTGVTILIIYIPVFLWRGRDYYGGKLFKYRLFDPIEGLVSYVTEMAGGYVVTSFSIVGLVFVLGGYFILYKKKKVLFYFFLSWFLIPFLFYGNYYFIEPRFLLVAFVPLSVIQGLCLAELIGHPHKKVDLLGKFSLVILLSVMFIRIYPVLSFRHKYALSPDYGRWIAKITEPDAYIIVGDEGTYIKHYGKKALIRQMMTDTSYYQEEEDLLLEARAYRDNIHDLLKRGNAVYITESALHTNNYDRFFYYFMKRFYHLTYVGEAPFEPWNRRCLEHVIYPIKLFKLSIK